jgi:hypothetical protein
MIIYILISFCLFFSFINFISIIFLSNFLFRVLVPKNKNYEKNNQSEDSGLVDLNPTVTYDPRFRK